jgi:chorismate mutase/prephenate dehydratase
MPSTADAADRAAREPRAAAIASRIAAHGRNLPIRAESIEDEKQNYTRFLVVGRQMVRPTGADKTSLIVTLKDKPGALHELLTPIREAELTLTRIESRPSRRQAWEYVFFIDLLGHVEDEKVAAALDRVRELAFSVKVLGAFPRGEGA